MCGTWRCSFTITDNGHEYLGEGIKIKLRGFFRKKNVEKRITK